MRCRKARFYLSAYCNDELVDRTRLAVSEHLSTCSTCRKEEAIYRSVKASGSEIESLKVADDFNAGLLNRIARERFTETRTKAYLPRSAPRLVWNRVVPVVAGACVVVLALAVSFPPALLQDDRAISTNAGLDDAYLTVQPDENPNMVVPMNLSWSLSEGLARAERITRISAALTAVNNFDGYGSAGNLRSASVQTAGRAPYAADYFRVRPVLRVYGAPQATTVKEVRQVY